MKRVVLTLILICIGAVVAAEQRRDPVSSAVYPPQRLPLIFSHGKHLERGVTCAACHPSAKTSLSAVDNLIPTEAACRACHAIDRTQPDKVATPVAACAGCHRGYSPGQPIERVYVMPATIKFAHSVHAKTSCEGCHGDMRAVGLATTQQLPTMASCFTCHTDGADSRNCTQCHFAKVGGLMETKFPHGDLVPTRSNLGDEHGPGFATDHRQQARRVDATCSACHDRSECIECHQGVVKPTDFHQSNYLLVHPIEAKRGKPDCTACHRDQTFCIGCHERSGLGTRAATEFNSVDPQRMFHPPGWASPGMGPNLHASVARRNINTCASCHREEDCLACHSAEPGKLNVSPHPNNWRGSARCEALDRGNRRMCLRCHITQDELGCNWSK